MTDKERLMALLDEWQVPYGENVTDIMVGSSGLPDVLHNWPDSNDDPAWDKIDGYSGFYTTFEFDGRGRFEKIGAWE